jgi:hypothetical protein
MRENDGVVYETLEDTEEHETESEDLLERQEKEGQKFDKQDMQEEQGVREMGKAGCSIDRQQQQRAFGCLAVVTLLLLWFSRKEKHKRVYPRKALAVCSVKVFTACNDAFIDEKTRLYLGRYLSLSQCQAACFEQKSCKTFTFHEHVPPLSSWPSILVTPVPEAQRRQAGQCFGRLDDKYVHCSPANTFVASSPPLTLFFSNRQMVP